MRVAIGTAGLVLALSGAGCGDPPPRPVPAAEEAGPSKGELFGSATLVPTRAGEQARAELALGSELTRVVEAMPPVESVEIAIALPPATFGRTPAAPSRALMTVALLPEADAASVRASVEGAARTWLGPDAELSVTMVESAPHAPPTEERPGRLLMIAVTLLGLGASLGVTVDRAFDRRRRKKRRPRVTSGSRG